MRLRAGASHPGNYGNARCVETIPPPPSLHSAHPVDSSASVFSIICAQDLEEDVGVGSVVGELQETREAAHPELKEEQKKKKQSKR